MSDYEALIARIETLATKQDLQELRQAIQQEIRDLELGLEMKLSAMQREQAAQRTAIAWLTRGAWTIVGAIVALLLRSYGII